MNQPPVNGRGGARRKGGTRIIVARGENIRTYRLNAWLFGSTVGLLLLFLTGYVGSTAYLIFRDDVLTAAVTRQVEIQYDYEDRISLLRSEIDRVTSRHIVETQSIEGQVSSLLERQDGLRRQQVLLKDLISRAREQGISFASLSTPRPTPRPDRPGEGKSDSDSDTLIQPVIMMTPEDGSSDQSAMAYSGGRPAASGAEGAVRPRSMATDGGKKPANIAPLLKDLRSSLDQFEQHQSMSVYALRTAAQDEAKRLTAAIRHFGVRTPPAPVGLLGDTAGNETGGPFVPADTSNLLAGMVTVQQTLQHIDLLKNSATAIPVRKPLPRIHVTSAFGYRVDPFLKKPGYHSGVDLRGAEGSPVSAAGAGKITHAASKGGYGLMVEISHSDGLKTRYGHLSAIKVVPGQYVNAGELVGLVGSTGRSTGPHLHYEAIRGGKTVDPMAFLAAGEKL